jgi:hypothetical protein
MTFRRQPEKWISKKSKAGFRGFPLGTIAYYGPDNRRASKVVVGIFAQPDSDPLDLRKWFSDIGDVRSEQQINGEIVAFLREHGVHSVTMSNGIIGCPHEEIVDYPEGEACPQCPFWANRDRWTGDLL